MRTNSRLARAAAPALFCLGVLWLAGLAFVAAWPDMEASFFDPATSLAADAGLPELRCPWVIAANEAAAVRAEFANPTDRVVSFLVRTRITSGFVTLVHQDSQQVTIPPHGSQAISWPVSAADAAYRRLVLVRVLAMRSGLTPARESACGILVAGISGIRGQWLFAIGVLVGLALAGAAAAWWWLWRRPLGPRDVTIARRAGFLAVIVATSLITGMLDQWLISHLLLVAAALGLFVVLEQTFLHST